MPRPSRPGPLAPFLILVALACLAGAWVVPVMQGTALFFFSVSKNMLDVLRMLVDDGDYLVAGILVAFALVVPALKLILMLLCWTWLRSGWPLPRAVLKLLELIGRWAMLDIFVAALVVTAVKLDGTPVKATTGTAVTLLVGAFVCSSLASWRLKRVIRKGTVQPAPESGVQIDPVFGSEPPAVRRP